MSGNECKIIIKRGLAEEVCNYLPLEGVVRIAIVTDSNVAPLYLAKIKKQLCDAVQVYSYVLQAGEQNKTMASVQQLYGFFVFFIKLFGRFFGFRFYSFCIFGRNGFFLFFIHLI